MPILVREEAGLSTECPHCNSRITIPYRSTRGLAITSPSSVLGLFPEMGILDREEMRCVYLNTRNRVLDTKTIYYGNVSEVIGRVAEIFQEAVKHNYSRMIIVHNHPSGEIIPSPDDLHFTQKVTDAGKLLDIHILDHVILAADKYYSIKEHNSYDFPFA